MPLGACERFQTIGHPGPPFWIGAVRMRVAQRGILNPGIPKWILPNPTNNKYLRVARPRRFGAAGIVGRTAWFPSQGQIQFGPADLNNAMPPLAPFSNPTYIPPTAACTSCTPPIPATPAVGLPIMDEIQVQTYGGPATLTTGPVTDTALGLRPFIDPCVIRNAGWSTAAPPPFAGGRFEVRSAGGGGAPPPPSLGCLPTWSAGICGYSPIQGYNWQCTHIFLTIAPLNTPTVTAPWGAQILNTVPTAQFEVNGHLGNPPPFGSSQWSSCAYNGFYVPPAGPPLYYPVCPPPSRATPTNYPPACVLPPNFVPFESEGLVTTVQLVQGSAGFWTPLRGKSVKVQAIYMVPGHSPSTPGTGTPVAYGPESNTALVFSSSIQNYRVV